MSDLEERIRSFAIGNDSGDALLCRHPSCLHFGSHSSSSSFGVDTNLDQLIMDSWAVRLNHPTDSALLHHCLYAQCMVQYSIKVIVTVRLNHPTDSAHVNHSVFCTVHGIVQRQDECHMSAANSQQLGSTSRSSYG